MNKPSIPGLSENELNSIRAIAITIPTISSLLIFGSRATGNHKPFSDVDIAITGDSIDWQTAAHLKTLLEETTFPYFVDVVAIDNTLSDELRESIGKTGISI